MKTLCTLCLLLCLSPLGARAQIVDIPDPVFKYILVNLAIADTDGDGDMGELVDTNSDGEIQVSEAEAVFGLNVAAIDLNGEHIQSLEGLEAFVNLEQLYCAQQEISVMDVTNLSQLRVLVCNYNLLPSLDVSQNTLLEKIDCSGNPISGIIDTSQCTGLKRFSCVGNQTIIVDVTQNPQLEVFYCRMITGSTIDLSQNTALYDLFIVDSPLNTLDLTQNPALMYMEVRNTQLTEIDLTQNLLLRVVILDNNLLSRLDVSGNPEVVNVWCNNNQLTELNVRNGNNANFFNMKAEGNPSLSCIEVDDVGYANAQPCNVTTGWCKDETATYSEDCQLGNAEVGLNPFVLYPNPAKDLLSVEGSEAVVKVTLYDLWGRKLLEATRDFAQIPVGHLPAGILLVEVATEKGTVLEKVVKG
ncbi:MAG: T9SS type A sorting domain-containing protein [Flavobacteriaceae bacterium]